MRKMNCAFFTQELWRNGYIGTLGLQSRFYDITSNRGKEILKNHTVAWCRGESLFFRAKKDHVALMCFKDGIHFWFHIRNKEFDEIWGDVNAQRDGYVC